MTQFDNKIISRIFNKLNNYHFLCIEDSRENNIIDKNVKRLLDKKKKKIKDVRII